MYLFMVSSHRDCYPHAAGTPRAIPQFLQFCNNKSGGVVEGMASRSYAPRLLVVLLASQINFRYRKVRIGQERFGPVKASLLVMLIFHLPVQKCCNLP